MSKDPYDSLLNQISKILEETRTDFKEGSNRFVLTSNWEIGKRITEVEQGGEKTAKYGVKVIERLSKDLNSRFGGGYSEKNLFGMRKFYQYYKPNQIKYSLSWTHYRSLVSISDPETRRKLESLAAEKNWTHRKLDSEILSLRKGKGKGESGEEKGFLERQNGHFYHYLVKKETPGGYQEKFLKTGGSRRNLDLGFSFFLESALGDTLKKFKDSEIIRVIKTGKSSYKFVKSEISRSEIFTYKAFPERIVDGDTLLVTIDLGFRTSTKQRLRFRGIDSPEKGDKGNEKVEKFVAKRLKSCKFIVIRTHRADLYGRYLADVFYSEKERDMEKVLEKGNFLNNELLESGLVRVE